MLKGRRAEEADRRLESGRAEWLSQLQNRQAGSSQTVTPLRKWDCDTEKEVLCRKTSVGGFFGRHNCPDDSFSLGVLYMVRNQDLPLSYSTTDSLLLEENFMSGSLEMG